MAREPLGPGATALWAAAATLPAVAYAIVAMTTVSRWSWAMSVDALLLSTACMLVAAPLTAVAVMRQCRRQGTVPGAAALLAWRAGAVRIAAAIGIFVLVSALLAVLAAGIDAALLPTIAVVHVTLAAATVACAAVGVLAAAWLRDPLDAAAVSVTLTLAAGVGILIAGPGVGQWPRAIVDLALAASPVVACASAANIDLLRTGVLYHVSPIAHIQFTYPEWYSAAALYTLMASSCLAAAAPVIRSRSLDERMVP
jgi:hypothetical protein